MLLIPAFLFVTALMAQDTREALELRRRALQREIEQINLLRNTNKKEKENVLERAESLDQKIRITEELIRTTNREANLLTDEINTNQNRIGILREELKVLKEDYAAMIGESYRHRSKQSRIMFLFSSEDFLQAYKRLQYLKQYAAYREKQGEKIKESTQELQQLNTELTKQRKDKEVLVAQNRATQEKLRSDKKLQEQLITEINKKGSVYEQQLRQKQQAISRIDAEIQKMIREAIAAENKKKGSTDKNAFELTPEARALAANFVANRGKLPWPLKTGRITMPFGEHPSPIARNVTIQSNGIRIETNENEPVYAVFNGTVLKIQSIRGANKAVLIQHGNYISIYRNLTDLYIKNGQEVITGQKIGLVGHSRDTDRPTLNFYIFKDATYLDPTSWILRR